MAKWEYMVVKAVKDIVVVVNDEQVSTDDPPDPSGERIPVFLNRVGQLGWEAFSYTVDGVYGTLLMKRQLVK